MIRLDALWLIVLGSLAFALSLKPIAQDLHYHEFADGRRFVGVPRFMNVLSNLPFLIVGLLGLRLCRRADFQGSRRAWSVFFAGVTLVTFGSAYYHWEPGNGRLVWDRIPMTIAFMGLFVALLSESVSERLARTLLVPSVWGGMSTVIYWQQTDDLRIYAWVQVLPLLTIPAVFLLFPRRYTHQWLLLLALVFYVGAKFLEKYDRAIFEFTGQLVGGHAVKHLFAGLCCLMIYEMARRRKRIELESV